MPPIAHVCRALRTSALAGLVLTLLMFIAGRAVAAPVGAPAPGFVLDDQFGNTVTLEDFRGRGVILDFCALWCGACIVFNEDVLGGLQGQDLVLPVMMQESILAPADAADAVLWADAFALDQVLHVGGDAALMNQLINDFMLLGGSSIAFPTFVFIDANLDVVANLAGVGGPAVWDPLAEAVLASRVAVPAPAPLLLLLAGVLGLLVNPARRRQTVRR